MSEQALTTPEEMVRLLRSEYANGAYTDAGVDRRLAEFDRMLAEVKRAAAERAWDEGNEAGHESESHWDGWRYDRGYPLTNPYRREGEG